ncbi:MAG: glycerophosphoryl diester phosphodiesterase [Actinobacteria bacterium]|nr:glycerophosphoryl diester phosphodiesterase [Actinomycetota bacterium]
MASAVPALRRPPRVIAHRGMSTLAPENTLAAFRLCAAHGVRWFEFDCDLLADGTVVVIHDDTLDRTTDARGGYHALVAADLERIDAGSWFSGEFTGERLPTLPQVIALMNELGLDANLEIKSSGAGAAHARRLVAAVARDLESLAPAREVLVSSFNPVLLGEFHRLAPQWPVACLFEDRWWAGMWGPIADLLDAAAIHPELEGLSEKRVRRIRESGRDVNVWTVNSEGMARKLFGWGVSGVFTDVAQDFPVEWRSA